MHRLLVPGDYWSYTLRLPRKVNMKMNLLETIFKSKNMNQKWELELSRWPKPVWSGHLLGQRLRPDLAEVGRRGRLWSQGVLGRVWRRRRFPGPAFLLVFLLYSLAYTPTGFADPLVLDRFVRIPLSTDWAVLDKSWECQESNLGRLCVRQERCLCAMPSP